MLIQNGLSASDCAQRLLKLAIEEIAWASENRWFHGLENMVLDSEKTTHCFNNHGNFKEEMINRNEDSQ